MSTSAGAGDTTFGAMGPGSWVAWLALFDETLPEHAQRCTRDSTFLAFPADRVREVIAENPAIYPLIIAEVGRRLRGVMQWAARSSGRPVEARIANAMLVLADGSAERRVRLSQSRLAKLIGCSRQSANAVLRVLERAGAVRLGYGAVDVLDRRLLAEFAEAARSTERR